MFPNPFFKRPDTARYTTLRCPFTIHESKKKIYLKPPKSQVSILQMSRYIHFHWKKKKGKPAAPLTDLRFPTPGAQAVTGTMLMRHAQWVGGQWDCGHGRSLVRFFCHWEKQFLKVETKGLNHGWSFQNWSFMGARTWTQRSKGGSGYEVWLVPNLRLKQKLGAQLSLLDWKTLRFS